MKIVPQSINDVILIESEFHFDQRGHFFESYRENFLSEALNYKIRFIQENFSKSSKAVLRGLHYQLEPYAQTKLIRVIEGRILDVAVDIRKSSKTFGKHVAIELSDCMNNQLLIPKGFAHGFLTLTDSANVIYKVDNYYAPDYDKGIAFDDKYLGIDWKIPKKNIHLSESDRNLPTIENSNDLFE